MNNVKVWSISLLAAIFLAAGIGCAAFSQLVTPATINKDAVKYAAKAGVVDANDFRGFANLEKAIRLESAVTSAYQVNVLAYNQMLEKNELDYTILKGVATNNTKLAMQREAALFGEKGLLSMGLGLMGMGTLTGVLGLMRKRPGDITPQEMESALVDIKGEVTTKDRQFIEVVKGVQAFLEIHKTDPVAVELKACLQKQSLDTRQAVATARVTV